MVKEEYQWKKKVERGADGNAHGQKKEHPLHGREDFTQARKEKGRRKGK
jgi:hypothetical protein